MAVSKILFKVSKDKKLTEIVAKSNCFYNLNNSPLYRNHLFKDNAWKEV